MADVLTFYGYWHMVGETVRASIAGLDCGTAVVAVDGSVAITLGSDVGGLLTAAYLVTNSNALTGVEQNRTFTVYPNGVPASVTVPVVIGKDYTTQGQVLRPDLATDLHSPLGPGLGKTRRAHMVSALLKDAVSISFGTDFTTTLTAAIITTDGSDSPEALIAEDAPFSGVYWGPLDDSYGFDSMLAWQVNRPYACTICSVSAWVEASER